MSNDLLHPRYEKRPRTNYLAVGSNGVMALRSSHKDMYSHASLCINNEDSNYKFTYWVSFHSTKELADRQTKWGNKQYKERGYTFETIELQQPTTKEYKQLTKARLAEIKAKREAWSQQQAQRIEQVQQVMLQDVELQLITLGGN